MKKNKKKKKKKKKLCVTVRGQQPGHGQQPGLAATGRRTNSFVVVGACACVCAWARVGRAMAAWRGHAAAPSCTSLPAMPAPHRRAAVTVPAPTLSRAQPRIRLWLHDEGVRWRPVECPAVAPAARPGTAPACCGHGDHPAPRPRPAAGAPVGPPSAWSHCCKGAGGCSIARSMRVRRLARAHGRAASSTWFRSLQFRHGTRAGFIVQTKMLLITSCHFVVLCF